MKTHGTDRSRRRARRSDRRQSRRGEPGRRQADARRKGRRSSTVSRSRRATGSLPESSSIVEVPEPEPLLEAEEIEFGVVYEDEHLAVDRQAGRSRGPPGGRVGARGTLAGGLLYRWPRWKGSATTARWGIVHRLDRETSGLLVVALDAEALRRARGQRWASARSPASTWRWSTEPMSRRPGRSMPRWVATPGTRPGSGCDRAGRPARTHYRRTGGLGEAGA